MTIPMTMTMGAANSLFVCPEFVEGLVPMDVLSFVVAPRRDMRPTAHSLSFACLYGPGT
jgi:hypothetical protein